MTYAQIQAKYDAYYEECLKESKTPKDFWDWFADEALKKNKKSS
jgi:hypothetical protein